MLVGTITPPWCMGKLTGVWTIGGDIQSLKRWLLPSPHRVGPPFLVVNMLLVSDINLVANDPSRSTWDPPEAEAQPARPGALPESGGSRTQSHDDGASPLLEEGLKDERSGVPRKRGSAYVRSLGVIHRAR